MKIVLVVFIAGSLLHAGGQTSDHVATQLTLYKNPHEVLNNFPEQDRNCSMCDKDLLLRKKPVMEVGCGDQPHWFHAKCFNSWFAQAKTCPKCHAEIVTKEDEPKEAATDYFSITASGKFKTCNTGRGGRYGVGAPLNRI